ncbi:hypothetical protein SRS16CHR_02703 [Variovorax sp. SRS16]|uniref:hypothetical protein n=1 Tax=Variovorax sp. SRS16 TaxID=282217 RepID=UPI0013165932|nr:hypothetical protein [Variovorax sp. SRS16]VTU20734.1 hypothetical protein SRS16CHR_02703 [Variovorax sp. SRS16]
MDSTNTPLTDAQLAESHPAVLVLVSKLDDIARREPGGVAALAQAMAEYFRTPD